MASRIGTIPEIVDPPKSAGIVMTQMKSVGSNAMYHPVFKQSAVGKTSRPTSKEEQIHGKDKFLTVLGMTSVKYPSKFADPSAEAGDVTANLKHGFCGVCFSNTKLVSADETDSFSRSAKRRKREDPRISVAVAGTVTMPFWELTGTKNTVKPGDFVAFALGDNDDDVRVLHGSQSRKVPEYTPRIQAFTADRTCSAPFGVCVSVRPEEFQITVLLRLDLYNTYVY